MLAAAVVGVWAASAAACSVPVFRYALERWRAEPYEAYVFHQGAPTPEEQKAIDRLKAAEDFLDLRVIDLAAGPDAEAANVWESRPGAKPPWLVVRYPRGFGLEADAWAGPLGAEAVGAVLDSPARRAVARRILEGECAVFVLLESGDREKDDATARLLEEELAKLAKTLRLPEPPDGVWDDPVYDRQGAPPNLRVAFSMVRVSRKDPAERGFVRMLDVGEEDVASATGPVVFPFYGRGRALTALAGENLDAESIAAACEFFVGPCSCIIKGRAPGLDILMTVDWDAALAGEASAIPVVAPPPLAGVSEFIPGEVQGEPPPPEGDGSLVRNILLAAGGGIVIAAVAALAMRRKSRSA